MEDPARNLEGGLVSRGTTFIIIFCSLLRDLAILFDSLSLKYHLIFKRLRIMFKTLFNSYYFSHSNKKFTLKKFEFNLVGLAKILITSSVLGDW
jgi:hypothetical protein